MTYYNSTNTCDRCGYNLKLGPGHPGREYINEKWSGKWLCDKCRNADRRKRPDSFNNLIKSLANKRLGLQNPDSPRYKGDFFESITCKVRKIGNMNDISDNYNSPIDHTRDPILGIIDTRGRIYDPYLCCWQFKVDKFHRKIFDNLICYCADGYMNIIRVYIFPREEIIKRSGITIYNNLNIRGSWCDKYQVDVDMWMNGEIKYLM